ncbi:MAG TPA: DUF2284 domain-containing protein [Candidatus Pullilachnospira intestinigallinarum]|nr:DUF2284 domain-containing protein [Candidatus Pullilachnospira intestinigallinarum]
MIALSEVFSHAGVFQYGTVDTASIAFSGEVRRMCEVNTCRQYGRTWACPPGLGTLAECQKRIQSYEKMVVFSARYDLEDSFDYEGMMAGMSAFREVCRAIHRKVQPLLEHFLILSNEGCDLCSKCTYPEAPCRFPDRSHGSIEGYGILVSDLAGQAGINYYSCH